MVCYVYPTIQNHFLTDEIEKTGETTIQVAASKALTCFLIAVLLSTYKMLLPRPPACGAAFYLC